MYKFIVIYSVEVRKKKEFLFKTVWEKEGHLSATCRTSGMGIFS